MRLIDADALAERHCEGCGEVTKGICKDDPICATLMWAEEEPTAYYVDKVVEKLKMCSFTHHVDGEECMCDSFQVVDLKTAIRIVKGGGNIDGL